MAKSFPLSENLAAFIGAEWLASVKDLSIVVLFSFETGFKTFFVSIADFEKRDKLIFTQIRKLVSSGESGVPVSDIVQMIARLSAPAETSCDPCESRQKTPDAESLTVTIKASILVCVAFHLSMNILKSSR